MTPATPDKTSPILAEIEALGFTAKLEPEYPLGRLSKDRRIQFREESNFSPKDAVERFAIMMGEALPDFPPIVVTKDDWMVDGNTRHDASLRRKLKFFKALVLDVKYNGADQKTADYLHILAATLNSKAGVGLTAKERRMAVARFLAQGFTIHQIAKRVGLGTGTVTQVKREIAAAAKLASVGLSNGAIRGASLRALGDDAILALNDEPYRQLAVLAKEAEMNVAEIRAAAKAAKATGSDTAGLAVLADLRGQFEPRIREVALTGTVKLTDARMLRQHLGYVVKFKGNELALVETNAGLGAQHIASVRTSIEVLSALLRAQEVRTSAPSEGS